MALCRICEQEISGNFDFHMRETHKGTPSIRQDRAGESNAWLLIGPIMVAILLGGAAIVFVIIFLARKGFALIS